MATLKELIKEVLDTMKLGKDLDQALDWLYVKTKISGSDEFITEENIEQRNSDEIDELEAQLADSISKDDLTSFDKFFSIKNTTFLGMLERYIEAKTDICIDNKELISLDKGINEYGSIYRLTLEDRTSKAKKVVTIFQSLLLDFMQEKGSNYSLFVFEQ